MLIRTCMIVALLGLLPAASLVRAAPSSRTDDLRARTLFRQAEVHFNLQEFVRALELYTQAYKLKPLPGFLFNIGQCQRHLGQLKEALFSYRVYFARVPGAPNAALVQRLIREVEQRLASDAGHAPTTTIVPDATPDQPQPVRPASQPTTGPGDEEPPPPSRARWIWIGLGASVGAALLVTGLVTGKLVSDRSHEYQDPATSRDRRAELRSSGESLRTTSIVTLALAGAAAIGTGVYAIVSARSTRTRRSSGLPTSSRPVNARLSLLPTAGGFALGIGGEL